MRLQWGHGDGAVEEHRRLAAIIATRRLASMGPRRWSRGRARRSAAKSTAGSRLQWGHGDGAVEEILVVDSTGALVWLQWGHGDGAVEEILVVDSTGALVWLQWGHGDGAVEECGMKRAVDIGFPASMGPRRWSRGRGFFIDSFHSRHWASMGPRRWSRGRADAVDCVMIEHASFNGATAMEPWKSFQARGDRAGLFRLASMGPRRWSRGRVLVRSPRS